MYKADIKPADAFRTLKANPSAVLVDVRTRAEWVFVGIPDWPGLVQITWQPRPGAEYDARFVEAVLQTIPDKDTPVYLICRSGVRSAYAARALTMAGYTDCYNVAEGFEGGLDEHSHRGTIGGWKVAGLAWKQS